MATDRDRVLRDVFGFDALRPGQGEIIDDVLRGRPVVAVMPTGAGKSLCYQLPAVLLGASGAVTLVVSPLIALMKDQVDGLRALGVAAAALTSAASAAEQADLLEGIRCGAHTLVYVAPERFRSPRFCDALAALGDRLALVAIDEAHCISEWGHEFRPDYRRLGEATRALAPPRLIALTATATPEVRADIVAQLDLRDPALHVHGFDRPNLHYAVERAGGAADKAARIVDRVRRRASGVALVYAATRKNAERYAQALAGAGVRARAYHAGLADDDRTAIQDAFMAGDLDAVVATNAFGMGVDKSDVHLVVHADLPRSVEAYYQESGRGGRDGERTECVLLFNHADVRLQEFLIEASLPTADTLRAAWKALRDQPALGRDADALSAALPGGPHASTVAAALRILERHGYVHDDGDGVRAVRPQELGGAFAPLDVDALGRRADVERAKLRTMVEYGYAAGCRRRFMLDYFGDADWADPGKTCRACDNCKGLGAARPLADVEREQARALLGVVAALRGRFGRRRIAEVANGTDDDARLQGLPERGALRGVATGRVLDLLRAVEAAGLVAVSAGDYPTVSITARGRRALADDAELDGVACLPAAPARRRRAPAAAPAADPHAPPVDADLVNRLRQLRSRLAREQAVPAYVVFNDRTLDAIARARPRTRDELARVHGIGPAKLDRYGEPILAAVAGDA